MADTAGFPADCTPVVSLGGVQPSLDPVYRNPNTSGKTMTTTHAHSA